MKPLGRRSNVGLITALSTFFLFLLPLPSVAGPRLLFTDLTSGPGEGGQDDLGVFITLFGEGFGATRGNSTVTIGGQEVARYVTWGEDNAVARGLDMIVVQPGPAAHSGEIVVTVANQISNSLPFTIRDGHIYFVIPEASNASDVNSGTFEQPFQTIYAARHTMQSGDVTYVKGGTLSSSDPDNPGWDTILLLSPGVDANGTADRPVAWVGYPGDPPLLVGSSPLRRGIRMEEALEHYVISNLEFTDVAGNLQLSGSHHRAVGNYLHDDVHSEGAVIGISGETSDIKMYGNFLLNNGGSGEEPGHGFYIQGFGTNQQIDFGWNEIRNQRGRRGIQLFGHIAGDWMDDIQIHDNLVAGAARESILIGGSDGDTEVVGTVFVYNNILIDSDDQGIRINDPAANVFVQNNLVYNSGSIGFDGNAQIYVERTSAGRITLENNILYAEAGQDYYSFGPGMHGGLLNTNHNLLYNAGDCPTWDSGCMNADPLFASISAYDFRLQPGSPAIDAGLDTGHDSDFLGTDRPAGLSYDIGPIEFAAAEPTRAVEDPALPAASVRLDQSYPNPFNHWTMIRFHIPAETFVELTVYDLLGQEIRSLSATTLSAGEHVASWDGRDGYGRRVAAGMYLYVLNVGSRVHTRTMFFLPAKQGS